MLDSLSLWVYIPRVINIKNKSTMTEINQEFIKDLRKNYESLCKINLSNKLSQRDFENKLKSTPGYEEFIKSYFTGNSGIMILPEDIILSISKIQLSVGTCLSKDHIRIAVEVDELNNDWRLTDEILIEDLINFLNNNSEG